MVDKKTEKAARAVLVDNGFYNILPVDPINLAQKNGIEVKNATFREPEIAGAIMKKDGKTTILVNHADPISRKRFTIAHELGHYFLHLSGKDNEGIIDMYRTINGADLLIGS